MKKWYRQMWMYGTKHIKKTFRRARKKPCNVSSPMNYL